MTKRMNMFVNSLAQQCQRYNLAAELVIVEWNPPPERSPLRDELKWPSQGGMLDVRIITVPNEIHQRYTYADSLPLYQMIGKNVGILRSKADYILATNVDILFSEELIAWMASDQIEKGYNYHVDRFDVDMPIPDPDHLNSLQLLDNCRKNLLRRNMRSGSFNFKTQLMSWIYPENRDAGTEKLHTNACGDFALCHRDDWWATKAYPELDLFSFHIDSLWSYIAHFSGVREKVLEPPLALFHIEHGGGYTPETVNKMDSNLKERRLPRLSSKHLRTATFRMSMQRKALRYNKEGWGLPEDSLPEDVVCRAKWNDRNIVINGNKTKPLLSVVLAGRNDEDSIHGANPIQNTLDRWATIIKNHTNSIELIVVDWNTPTGQLPLSEILHFPSEFTHNLRIITVPANLHNKLPFSSSIDFYEWIARNIGIRHSNGEWITSCSPGTITGSTLVQKLQSGSCKSEKIYTTSNDSGDCILAVREMWLRLRGYPELPFDDKSIGSLLLKIANKNNVVIALFDDSDVFEQNDGYEDSINSSMLSTLKKIISENGIQHLNPPDWGWNSVDLIETNAQAVQKIPDSVLMTENV